MLKPLENATTECIEHGRVEIMKCFIINNLELIEQSQNWKNLFTLIKVESEIYNKKQEKPL